VKRTLLVIALLLILALASSAWLTRPVVEGELGPAQFAAMSLAPRGEAATLAVSHNGQVLLVTAVGSTGIEGVDLASTSGRAFDDAVDAYHYLGRAGLQALQASPGTVSLPWDEVGMPVLPHYPHIAAGTNYRAHAREVGVAEDEPFLFPKLSHPSPWNSKVLAGARLDYEVELCAVLLSGQGAQHKADLGYVLCGDFTDRWALVRDIDLDGAMGRSGFPLAKGGDSRLPLGPLLVVPFSDGFYKNLELTLFVNNTLRQRDTANSMVWSPREIIEQAMTDCAPHYITPDGPVSLTDCNSIPARTLVLTGTPAGVLFRLGTLWNPLAYLGEGDTVTSFATYLGYTQNTVQKEL